MYCHCGKISENKDTGESWIDVLGFEGHYMVSSLGRVKSVGRVINHRLKGKKTMPEIILKQSKSSGGYLTVHLNINGEGKTYRIHRIVMMSFKGNSELHVDHINGDRTDNRLINLRYCTQRENNVFTVSRSGKLVGASLRKSGKYSSYIEIKGKSKYLGSFNTESEAHAAYVKATQICIA